MKRYIRKIPLIVNAIEFDGSNIKEIEDFTEGEYYIEGGSNGIYTFSYHTVRCGPSPVSIKIGDFVVYEKNDWYVKSKAKFEAMYDEYNPNTGEVPNYKS